MNKHKELIYTIKLLFFGALAIGVLVMSCAAVAKEITTHAQTKGQLRLGIMPSSTHWDSSHDYNERHDGRFLEWRINDSDWLGGMRYKNSSYRMSNAWYWMREIPINDYMSFGYLLGGVTGYKEDRPMLFGSFMFTLRYGNVAVRESVIPLLVNGHQAYIEF